VTSTLAARAVVTGASALMIGAALVDIGFRIGAVHVERAGNAVMVVAGLGLAALPRALGTRGRTGPWLYWTGTALASLVDIPAMIDPADLRAGRVLGFPAMILLSAGLVMIWRRTRRTELLAAAAWFFVQLAPNVTLFIIPYQRPSFLLQVTGVAVALTVAAVRHPSAAADRTTSTDTPSPAPPLTSRDR
jgi:hypothetical protein